MGRYLLWAAVVLGAGAVQAAETTVPRYLLLRDGSVLRLPVVDAPWKLAVLGAEGQVQTRDVRLKDLREVRLTPEPPLASKQGVLSAVRRLGDDSFTERERAQAELLRLGASARPDLEVARGLFSDVEIQYRLGQVLEKLPAAPPEAPTSPPPFDLINAGEKVWGEAGDGVFRVYLDGRTVSLSRRDVAGMTVTPPAEDFLFPGAPAGRCRRIEEKEFPPGCLEEGFETAPDGRPLRVGENIERLFLPRGFVLSTSITNSFVSVNHFRVEGKTGGLSAATHHPFLYQGEVTIRFVQPGREDVPAGVTYFGCWLAVVMPRGTALVAYDAGGRELGRVETRRGPHEFVGLHSTVPMHRIRVVPNLDIDPDYTLDDFIYSPPQPIDVRHPERFTVVLADGGRLFCKGVRFTPRGVVLRGLPAGLPDRTLPAADLLRVLAPERGRPERTAPAGLYAELADGSVIFGSAEDRGGAPVFARRPQALRETRELVGLWKGAFPRTLWPRTVPPVAWDAERKGWRKVSDVKLEEEAAAWTADDGKRQTRPYAELDALLLAQPSPGPDPAGWHVRTVQGEDVVLDGGETPGIEGDLSAGLRGVWRGKPLEVSAADLVSVYRVPRGP